METFISPCPLPNISMTTATQLHIILETRNETHTKINPILNQPEFKMDRTRRFRKLSVGQSNTAVRHCWHAPPSRWLSRKSTPYMHASRGGKDRSREGHIQRNLLAQKWKGNILLAFQCLCICSLHFNTRTTEKKTNRTTWYAAGLSISISRHYGCGIVWKLRQMECERREHEYYGKSR